MVAPDIIGNAKVLLYTTIDGRHSFTNNTKHLIVNKTPGQINSPEPMHGLAICKYDNENSFYLFGCNSKWESITDTCHDTIEDAIDQAEFEYKGSINTWTKK
ncbi:MAG: hypothetical protein J0L69_07755 [Bacteroidetes bacterium]|nr:hypothetical protein [Bacteroidota bacterium]